MESVPAQEPASAPEKAPVSDLVKVAVSAAASSTSAAASASPTLLIQIQPEYSDDGRKARIQGTVELLIVVKPDGTVKFDNVRKSLGYGLDQKAIDAVRNGSSYPARRTASPSHLCQRVGQLQPPIRLTFSRIEAAGNLRRPFLFWSWNL